MSNHPPASDTENFWKLSAWVSVVLALASAAIWSKSPIAINLGVIFKDNTLLEKSVSANMLFMVPVLTLAYVFSLMAAIKMIDRDTASILRRLALPNWNGVPLDCGLGGVLRVCFLVLYLVGIPISIYGSFDWFFRGHVYAGSKMIVGDSLREHLSQFEGFDLQGGIDYRFPDTADNHGFTFHPGLQPVVYLLLAAWAASLLMRVVWLVFAGRLRQILQFARRVREARCQATDSADSTAAPNTGIATPIGSNEPAALISLEAAHPPSELAWTDTGSSSSNSTR